MTAKREFSIKTLTDRFKYPAPKKTQCLYLHHVSQLVRDTTGSGENYIDSHYQCGKSLQRITKRTCLKCKMYSPIESKWI